MITLANRGVDSNQMVLDVRLANIINSLAGGAVVGPWDLGDIPEDWLTVFSWMINNRAAALAAYKKKESAFEEARKDHKTFRK